MFPLLLVSLSPLLLPTACSSDSYTQHRQLMPGGKLTLSWRTDRERMYFQLSGKSSAYVGLAFSYNSLPVDGFIAGLDTAAEVFAVDVHLDYAGKGWDGLGH